MVDIDPKYPNFIQFVNLTGFPGISTFFLLKIVGIRFAYM